MEFFRFPHTPHIAWLGNDKPRDDKVLSSREAQSILAGDVVVEEKIDGANVGISVDESGILRAQNRGSYLTPSASHPQFKPLFTWLEAHRSRLSDALFPNLILFGEWCWAMHSVHYTRLPDWFLAFDVYDRARGMFWSVARRDALVLELELRAVPHLDAGRFTLAALTALLGPSQLTDGPAEGLYIRRDEGDHLAARAKLVRPEFVHSIGEHWSRRVIRPNELHRI